MRQLAEHEERHLIDLVGRSFASLNITPYPWQEDAVYMILDRFIYQNVKNVILAADTGVGKSMIGAAVSLSMGMHLQTFDKPTSTIMMHQNLLVDQYADSLNDHDSFMRVKGAANFDCIIEDFPQPVTAEDCRIPALRREHKKSGGDSKLEIPIRCHACEYMKQATRARKIPHIVTNFQYHMAKTIKGNVATDRPVAIFDEGHTLNDVAVDSMTIELSESTFVSLNNAIKYAEKVCDMDANLELVDKLAVFSKVVLDAEAYFKETNLTELRFINLIQRLYDALVPVCVEMASDHIITDSYENLIKATKRFDAFKTLYASYFNNKELTEYVYDRDDTEKSYKIKPVFVKGLSSLILTEYNLFMSATITDDYMIETIGLDPEKTSFIILPSVYPRENKPIFCISKGAVTFSSLQNPKTMTSLATDVSAILSRHLKLKQSGLAFTNSFQMAEQLYNEIPKHLRTHIILHKRGEKVSAVVAKMKASNKPMLLISPSIFEGVDFKGDHSSYQIILKAPYPSLADKRIALIASRYSGVYKTITLMKIVQGVGRSVRSKTERALTYILDSNIEKLLYSNLNVWKHTHILHREFNESYLRS